MLDSEPYYTRCIGLAVIALGVFVYANTLTSEFVWDDASSILLHQTVQQPSEILRLFKEDQHAYAGGQGNFYRPLLAVTFLIDFWLSYSGPTIQESTVVISELSPFLFHLDSILWHCLAALFFMLLLKNFSVPMVVRVSAPLIYVVHPLHTEAVAYISGRADSMSAAFIFAGLYCATRKSEGNQSWILSFLALLCFVAGLLSKESSFIFPGLLLLGYFSINRINEQKWQVNQWVTFICTGMILVVYGFLRTGNGPLNFGSDTQPPTSSFGERIIETVQSFAYYIQLLFVPGKLHMERTLEHATSSTTFFGFASLFLVVLLAGYGLVRLHHRIFIASSWFILTWLPISGLFPLNAPMAEHWMYVPMGGFLWLLLELLLVGLPGRLTEGLGRRYQYAMGVVICVWGIHLTMVSIERNLDWRSNVSIYEATLRENSKSSRVHYNLAVTYEDLHGNNEGAKRHYGEVIALYEAKKAADTSLQAQYWDEEIQSHFSLGRIHLEQKQYNEAANHFGVLGSLTPTATNRDIVGMSLFGLGQCYLYSGERDQAQQLFNKAVEIIPSLASEIPALF